MVLATEKKQPLGLGLPGNVFFSLNRQFSLHVWSHSRQLKESRTKLGCFGSRNPSFFIQRWELSSFLLVFLSFSSFFLGGEGLSFFASICLFFFFFFSSHKTQSSCCGFGCFLIHFIIPFMEIRVALPGWGYSSRKSSAAQSYRCMLGLFVFP